MSVKNLFLFFALVAICIMAASINMHQSTIKQFEDFQKLEQDGSRDAAASGYRSLAMRFPYTAAGIKSVRKLAEEGGSVAGLSLQILKAGVVNTTASEWFVLISAFFVTTVFIRKNTLPSSIFIPFVISATGMFHLSHPLVSTESPSIRAFLAINPICYTALTLLIAAGYICNRWETSGKTTYRKAFAHDALTLGEQLLAREMCLKKLWGVQKRLKRLKNDLKTPHGLHFVSEVNRLCRAVQNERRQISKQLKSAEVQYQEMTKNTQEVIDRCRQELIETKILFRSKAFNRNGYNNKRKEINAVLKKSLRRISEFRARTHEMKTVHGVNRLQFARWDVFSMFMNEYFTDEQGEGQKIMYKEILFHPQSAKENIMRRKLLYRQSSAVGGKLIKLEQRRSKLKETVYRKRLAILRNEKKILDRELVVLADKISEQMATCKDQQGKLANIIEALSAERADMKALSKIRGCFPAQVKSRRLKIRQDLKFCRYGIPLIREVEKTYKISQRLFSE